MRKRVSTPLLWAGAGLAAGAVAAKFLAGRRTFDLAGKTVLVTGGSRGLGLAIAREFRGRGCNIAICARDKSELERASGEFTNMGDRFLACQCDLTEPGQVARMTAEVESTLGPIDVLVNNAGVIQVGPLENQTLEDFQAAMDGNFWSAVNACLAVIPHMKRRGDGRIVNISSIGGKIAVPHLLPYCASKFALAGFSTGLQVELAKDGISVTTIFPGLMRTGSPRNIDVKGQHEKEYGSFIVAGSMPILTLNVTKAARRIVNACASRKREVTLGAPAKLAAGTRIVVPNLLATILAKTNQWLMPSPSTSNSRKNGFESESTLTRSPLTSLTRGAEARQNQLPN